MMATRPLMFLALAVVLAGRASAGRIAPCIVLASGVAIEGRSDGAGECGKASAEVLFMRMTACLQAMQDPQSSVSSSCCSAVKTLIHNPGCLCAVFLSHTAKATGVQPEMALAIPKRCNMADRPVGYKCGAYTMP